MAEPEWKEISRVFDAVMDAIEDAMDDYADDVMEMVEGLYKHMMKQVLGIDIKYKFPRISHSESMNRYGCDKPDLRFGLELTEMGVKTPLNRNEVPRFFQTKFVDHFQVSTAFASDPKRTINNFGRNLGERLA